MSSRIHGAVLIAIIAFSGCGRPPEGGGSLSGNDPALSTSDRALPLSWRTLEVAELNAQIDAAVASGTEWPSSPLMVTLQLFGDDRDVRTVALEEKKNRGEGADAATVVYIRDGFLDDSLRGDWYEIHYRRILGGTWRIDEARVAFRCWRGENTAAYGADLCP